MTPPPAYEPKVSHCPASLKGWRQVVGVRVLALLVFLAVPAWPLFTGNDQFDRTDLNTEQQLDSEYFLDVMSYRPFWRPPPAAEESPAFIRNSEGSLSNDEFYILRQARIRGKITDRSFWGYQLIQEEDLEEEFFYQVFEGEMAVWGPLSLRVFGQPTHNKQDSDLGVGGVWAFSKGRLTLEGTLVDFMFNSKNVDEQHDRNKLYNVVAKWESRWGNDASGEIRWEWDSPVEREFLSEGTLFGHRASQFRARMRNRYSDIDLFYKKEHRMTASHPGDGLLQDFGKTVLGADGSWLFTFRNQPGRLGLQLQRRRADFTNTVSPDQTAVIHRWVADPYIAWDIALSKRCVLETAFFSGWVWEKIEVLNAAVRDTAFQAKLKTGLRIDFTPHVGLLLNPTWDLDELGSGRTFDGGNVQLRAQLP